MVAKSSLEFPKVFDFGAEDKHDFFLFEPPVNTVELKHFAPTWTYIYVGPKTKREWLLVTHVQIGKYMVPPIATLSRIIKIEDESSIYNKHQIPVYTTVIPIDRVGQLLEGCSKRAYRRGYYRGKRAK